MAGRDATDGTGPHAGLLLPATVLAAGVLAGWATARLGSAAGIHAIYFVVVTGLLVAGIGLAITRPEPLRFVFLALVAMLPLAGSPVPPGRLGLTVFDITAVLLACGLLVSKAFAATARQPGQAPSAAPILPARSFGFMWLLLLPCVLLARHPLHAIAALLLLFADFTFFWFALQELRRPRGFERIVVLLCVAVIAIAGAVLLDHFLQMSLSLRGRNLNQLSYSGGLEIRRAGGFFQDPQKAGAFLASTLAFLLVLAVRRRFQVARPRLLLWCALLLGTPALLMTVSRAAIIAFALVATLVLVLGSRWPLPLRLAAGTLLLVSAALLVMSPGTALTLLPAALVERLTHSQDEFQFRTDIWFDTWDMFANHPLTGIGLGGFQSYLLDTRPTAFNYYDIGTASGVAYVPDQPESGYFKILYETGIAGCGAVLVLVVATLRRMFTTMVRAAPRSAERTESGAALAGLLCFALTFATLFTSGDPRVLAVLAILLAVVWRDGSRPSSVPAPLAR